MTTATSTGSLLLNPSPRGSGSAAARAADHTSLDVADLLDPVLRRAVDYFASALDLTSTPDCEYVVVGTTGKRRGFMLGSASAARWELPFVLVNSVSVDAEDEPDAESLSAADAIRSMRNSAGDLRELMSRLNDADRERAWAEIAQQLRQFEGPNGFEAPGEVLIGVGTK